MNIETLATQVTTHLDSGEAERADRATPMPHVTLVRRTKTTRLAARFYEPSVCLILQGRRETTLGETTHKLEPGESMVVSHALAVASRVTRALKREPYLEVRMALDVPLLRSLYEEVGRALVEDEEATSVAAHDTDPRVIDGFSRYLALAADPIETKVLAPLVLKELHFRLLMAPHGAMLRQLLLHDSHASNIARAIARIRGEFLSPIAVPELARSIGMSPSSFHKHFKDITATTPLQYQKELRLQEARRLLRVGEHSVSGVASEVGYESPNQFSREYVRRFGKPPGSDLRAGRRAD